MTGPFDQAADVHANAEHLPEPLPEDPFPLFMSWYKRAQSAKTQPNPNAMTLATVDPDGRPAARMVLCKGIEPTPGILEFFTNYNSRKAQALDSSHRAALLLHWDHLDRQVRIEGLVVRSPALRNDEYFTSRPWESRIGAWASEQGQPVASREAMLERLMTTMTRFGLDPFNPPTDGSSVKIPRPPHWGGYRLCADRVELWVSGPGRLHDRAAWTRTVSLDGSGGFKVGSWSSTRLQP